MGSIRGELSMAWVAVCLQCGKTELRNMVAVPTRLGAIRSFKKAGWTRDSKGKMSCAGCSAVGSPERLIW